MDNGQITGGYDVTLRNRRIKELAREQHQSDGECEIDDNALISEGDENGAYVQAWVWVDFAGTDLDTDQRFIEQLEKRSMSAWSDEELKRYSELTGQGEP